MNPKLALALALVPLMVLPACAPATPPATATPLPTSTAVPTQTAVPTSTPTPTAVPTPTATPAPGVWDIAKTLLAECQGSSDAKGEMPIASNYAIALRAAAIAEVPQLAAYDYWVISNLRIVLPNDGTNPGPFADANRWIKNYFWKNASYCDGYILAYRKVTMNTDRSGKLTGEAYLFYMTKDGAFKEVHFTFPPSA